MSSKTEWSVNGVTHIEAGDDKDHQSDSGDGEAHDHGYIDPEAAQYNGITPTPTGLGTALNALRTTIRVVHNDNDPLSNYEVPPTGIHDAYGPIALYGGDPDATYVGSGFGIAPAFARVPQPEYDPNLSEQKPPMNAPPDGTCLYCFQPPANP